MLVPIQDLGDVDVLDREAGPVGAALLVHQAGTVGRGDILRPALRLVLHLVVTHLGRHALLEHGKGAAEAAALVGPGKLDELDAAHLGQQVPRLGELLHPQLGHAGNAEAAQRVAVVVQRYLVRELGPGERFNMQDVVQELDQLERLDADLLHLVRLLDGVQVVANLVDAAPGRRHHVIVRGEVPDEQRLGRRGLFMAPGVGHRLAAAGLVARVIHVEA